MIFDQEGDMEMSQRNNTNNQNLHA